MLEYMSKKKMVKTAEIFKKEAKLPDHAPGPMPGKYTYIIYTYIYIYII